jgi:hypothetical protein
MDRYTSLMENKCILMADDNSANQNYRSNKNGKRLKRWDLLNWYNIKCWVKNFKT